MVKLLGKIGLASGGKGKTPTVRKPNRPVLGQLEHLEDRSVPATLYVGLASDYTITQDISPSGLSLFDKVTWNGPSGSVSNLTYGQHAFGTISSAVSVAGSNDTIRVAASTFSDGAVSLTRSLTFDIPAGAGGFSLVLGGSSNLNLTLTGNGSVPVTGNSGSNQIVGNNAANTINGSSGTDTIRGGLGDDSITGGTGIDTAEFTGSRSNYTISVNGSTVTVSDLSSKNNEGIDTLIGVERLSFKGDVVRAVPSSLDFQVGTKASPKVSSLVFGSAFVNSAATGNQIQVTMQLDQGSDSDGNFVATNDGTLVSLNVANGGKEIVMQGTASALNAFLNSGKIQYSSKTGTQRLVKMTSSNDNLSDTGWTYLNGITTVAPVFTSANSTAVTYGNSVNFTVTTTSTPAATYSITTGSLPGGISLNSSTGLLSGSTNAGTYNFTITASNGTQTTNQAFTLTVNQAALTVTATAQSKAYGDSDPALTYSVTAGALVGSDAFTGALSRSSGEDAGTYAINQGTLSAGSNYTVTFVGANLTVGKATLGISADAKSKTYGDSDPNLTYVISGLKNGDTSSVVTGALSRVSGENAGTYAINQGTVVASANYDVVYTGADLTINKRLVTASATASNKTFDGNTNASAQVSVTGLPGDDLSVSFGSATFDSASVGFEKTVTVSGLVLHGAAANNYQLANTTTTATANITGSGIVGTTLQVVGSGLDDEFIIAINTKNITQAYVIWKLNGVTTTSLFSITGLTGVTVHGADGNDKLTMNAEVPLPVSLYGDNGNDILRGGNYNDSLFGGEGTDTLYGSLGDDTLDGGASTDTLFGQDGNDTLIAGAGDTVPNTLDGGNGSDTLIGAEGDDTLTGGSNSLSDGADTIQGFGGNDKIFGGNGNDNLSGGDGADTIDGGNGNDSISGGEGNDTLNGSFGDDTINGDAGDDTINGGDGNDTVAGGLGNDVIHGTAGDDTLNGGEGNNIIQGGDGNDIIAAGEGNNFILGQAGNDTISVGNGNNIVVGGLGNDTISTGNGNNLVIGGAGLDTITVGNGSNLVIGSSTTYDANESNLRTIHNEWLRTDISTTQKKANLSAGVNGVKLALGQTVIDDLSVDQIFAGSGDNWLWI